VNYCGDTSPAKKKETTPPSPYGSSPAGENERRRDKEETKPRTNDWRPIAFNNQPGLGKQEPHRVPTHPPAGNEPTQTSTPDREENTHHERRTQPQKGRRKWELRARHLLTGCLKKQRGPHCPKHSTTPGVYAFSSKAFDVVVVSARTRS